ncbi:MAG: RloB domain-containing protein [Myxococcales bacterium]|nr:RloB domain-containing protein [Myxococcales bacterium]
MCEGEVTEREYFEAFRAWCKNPRVEIDFDGPAGVPLTLVNRAKDRRETADREANRRGDDFLRYDEVWCVFDVDEHPHVPDARDHARAAGLRLAMSNPCFELWLLLHFTHSPGMQHRDDMQARLRALMPAVPRKHVDFEALIAGYDDAYRRADRLARDARDRGDPVTGNPSTEVYLLTASIDEDGARRRARPTVQHDNSRAKAQAAAEAAAVQVKRELRAWTTDGGDNDADEHRSMIAMTDDEPDS